jgi:membrane protein involved in colicin uptake
MAETEQEKADREKKEAEAKAAKDASEAAALKAKEAEDTKEAERKKKASSKDPHESSADMTREHLDEWQKFKKNNPAFFAQPGADGASTKTSVASHDADCVFGPLCPFPNEPH